MGGIWSDLKSPAPEGHELQSLGHNAEASEAPALGFVGHGTELEQRSTRSGLATPGDVAFEAAMRQVGSETAGLPPRLEMPMARLPSPVKPQHESQSMSEAVLAATGYDSVGLERPTGQLPAPVGASPTHSSSPLLPPELPERPLTTALIENDIGRIPTPSSSVVAPYRDPKNLPPASGESRAFGYNWVHFGPGVSLHKEYLTEHQELRQIIASTPEGQMHLAHQEQTPGMHTWVTPYSAYSDRPRVEHLDDFIKIPRGQATHNPTVTLDYGSIDGRPVVPPPVLKRQVMAYSIDQGKLENNAQLLPPASAGAHEWAHASRADKFGTHAAGTIPAGRMGDGEEGAAVAFQNLTGRASNMGQRDSYGGSAYYRTSGLSSSEPVNPAVQAVIDAFQPRLNEATNKLTDAGANPRNPSAEHEKLYRRRERLVDKAYVALHRADPPRTD